MILTWIGFAQLVVGLVLVLAGRFRHLFLFMMLSGLLGGSASLYMPALGNSSVPPIQFALLFVFMRVLMPRGGHLAALGDSIRDNGLFVLFTFYGLAAAFAAPRIFAGTMDVAPLRFAEARGLFDVVPLEPTSQNITASVYLVGGLLVALAAHVAMRAPGGVETLVKGGVWIAWIHVALGIFDVLVKGTPAEALLGLFRNGSYGQLNQSYQGFIRIAGIFPETSGYAVFGLTWFVFHCECWYRSVLPRATGAVTLALGLVLFFSTSSTAYVGLGCYAVFFVVRLALLPGQASPTRLRQAGLCLLAIVALTALAIALVPRFAQDVVDMLRYMTVDKQDSISGRQRYFWAMQGFDAFVHSHGLGIGPGSFRSSSLFTAILGTMGVVGIASFTAYVIQVLKPLRASTWGRVAYAPEAIGAACATTALIILIPAAISSPNTHPGTSFAILAGAALALRRARPAVQGTAAPEAMSPAGGGLPIAAP